jgi:hypothetical protein
MEAIRAHEMPSISESEDPSDGDDDVGEEGGV